MTVVNVGKTGVDQKGYDGEVILFKQPTDECCLFVGGLTPDITTEELYEPFSKYGLISSCQIIADTDANRKLNLQSLPLVLHQIVKCVLLKQTFFYSSLRFRTVLLCLRREGGKASFESL